MGKALLNLVFSIGIISSFACLAEAEEPWKMDFLAGESISYDDNVTFAHEDRRENFINNLSLGFIANYEERFLTSEIKGNVIYQTYSEDDQFDNLAEDLSISLKRELSEYKRFTVDDKFVHAQEPRTFEDIFGRETDVRGSYYRNNLLLAYNQDVSSQFSLSGRYRNEFYKSSGLTSYLNVIGGQMDYFLSSADVISPMYDLTLRFYDPSGHSLVHSLAANYRHYFTKQLYTELKPGVDVIDPASGKDVIKPHWTASLIDDVDKATRMALVYEKAYFTTAYSRELLNAWQVTAYVIRQLLPRLSSTVSAFYGEGEYVTSSVSQKLYGASGTLLFDVTKDIQALVSYTHSRHESNVSTQAYTRNVISAGVVIRF